MKKQYNSPDCKIICNFDIIRTSVGDRYEDDTFVPRGGISNELSSFKKES